MREEMLHFFLCLVYNFSCSFLSPSLMAAKRLTWSSKRDLLYPAYLFNGTRNQKALLSHVYKGSNIFISRSAAMAGSLLNQMFKPNENEAEY